jgi:hypothetical protein
MKLLSPSLQENFGELSQLGDNPVLPNPSEFIIWHSAIRQYTE